MQTRQSYRRLNVHVDEVLDIAACAFMLARKRLTNHHMDMTIINTYMFGIMFEVALLIASFEISTFVNKPLFIHTSEKL